MSKFWNAKSTKSISGICPVIFRRWVYALPVAKFWVTLSRFIGFDFIFYSFSRFF